MTPLRVIYNVQESAASLSLWSGRQPNWEWRNCGGRTPDAALLPPQANHNIFTIGQHPKSSLLAQTMSATGEDKGWHSQSEDIDARVWQQPEDPRPRPSPQNLCPVTPAASRAPAAPTTPKPYHSPWERLQHSGWDERLGLKRGLDSPQKQVLAASANDLSAQVRKSTTSQVKVPFQVCSTHAPLYDCQY